MELVQIYTARDGMEAQFLVGLLKQQGIEAAVMGENLGIARGDLPLGPETLPSVWVQDRHAEAAGQLVEEFVSAGQLSPMEKEMSQISWRCPGCGETLEGQFSQCWKCQTERPEADRPPIQGT